MVEAKGLHFTRKPILEAKMYVSSHQQNPMEPFEEHCAPRTDDGLLLQFMI